MMQDLILPVGVPFLVKVAILIVFLLGVGLAFLITNNKYCLIIAKTILQIIIVIILAILVSFFFIWIFR